MRLWDMQGNEIKELKRGVACLDVSIVDDGGEMVEEWKDKTPPTFSFNATHCPTISIWYTSIFPDVMSSFLEEKEHLLLSALRR